MLLFIEINEFNYDHTIIMLLFIEISSVVNE